MPEHRCVNVGAISCNGHFRADTMEELLRQVAKHLKEKHAVATPTQTVMNYVVKMAGK
jgi:predicted small metal-binding protein